jgi:hypothetical protein
MGTYASVIVFPEEPRKPSLFARLFRGAKVEDLPPRPEETRDLETTARRILRVFERHRFVKEGVSRTATRCDRPTSAACEIFNDKDKRPVGLEWWHFAIDAADLQTEIAEVIWTQTVREWYEGLGIPNDENPDALAVPSLDVMVFSREVEILDPVFDRIVCRPWVLIEFSFEDCRLSHKIHTIRNFHHPFFAGLTPVFGRRPAWAIRAW